jgi:hypothetical protein
LAIYVRVFSPCRRVSDNASAINALFNSQGSDVVTPILPTTTTPATVQVQTVYKLGEAEIAIIVVAGLIFIGSFIAILVTVRAWKKLVVNLVPNDEMQDCVT